MPPDNAFGVDDSDWTPPPPVKEGEAPLSGVPAQEATDEDLLGIDPGDSVFDEIEDDPFAPAEDADSTPPAGQAAPTPPATQPPVPGAVEALEQLVGEGRKFADVGELARAHVAAQQLIGRQGERLGSVEARTVQLEQMLRQAAAMQQQEELTRPSGPIPLDPRLVAAAEEAGLDENALRIAQILAEQSAERRVGPIQQRLAAEAREAQERQAREAQAAYARQQGLDEVEAFRGAHPEYASPDQVVGELRDTFNALDVWEDDPLQVTAQTLEIVHEAKGSPALLEVLSAMPEFMDTPQGMVLARRLAAGEGTPAPAAPGTAPAKPTTPRLPHVETGGTGPKPEAAGADDEWAVMKLARAEKQIRSPLGI